MPAHAYLATPRARNWIKVNTRKKVAPGEILTLITALVLLALFAMGVL